MEAADRKILLIDSSKFGKTSLIKLATLTEFTRDVFARIAGLDVG